jgi:hypothetical protein
MTRKVGEEEKEIEIYSLQAIWGCGLILPYSDTKTS